MGVTCGSGFGVGVGFDDACILMLPVVTIPFETDKFVVPLYVTDPITDLTDMSTDPGAKSVSVVTPCPDTNDKVRTTGSSRPDIVTAAELDDAGKPEITNFRLPVVNTLIKSSLPVLSSCKTSFLLGG